MNKFSSNVDPVIQSISPVHQSSPQSSPVIRYYLIALGLNCRTKNTTEIEKSAESYSFSFSMGLGT